MSAPKELHLRPEKKNTDYGNDTVEKGATTSTAMQELKCMHHCLALDSVSLFF